MQWTSFLPQLKICFSFYFSFCTVTSCLWHVHRSKVFCPLTGDIIWSCTVSKLTELRCTVVAMVSLCALNLGCPLLYLASKYLANSCVWLCQFKNPHCAGKIKKSACHGKKRVEQISLVAISGMWPLGINSKSIQDLSLNAIRNPLHNIVKHLVAFWWQEF